MNPSITGLVSICAGNALSFSICSQIFRYLLLHWKPDAIVETVHCCVKTVYNIEENLFMYGSPYRLQFRSKGGPRKLHTAAEKSLVKYFEDQPWAQQKEMVWFINRRKISSLYIVLVVRGVFFSVPSIVNTHAHANKQTSDFGSWHARCID